MRQCSVCLCGGGFVKGRTTNVVSPTDLRKGGFASLSPCQGFVDLVASELRLAAKLNPPSPVAFVDATPNAPSIVAHRLARMVSCQLWAMCSAFAPQISDRPCITASILVASTNASSVCSSD